MTPVFNRPLRSLQRNILAGIITIGPLVATWLIFNFLFTTLARAGMPLVTVFERFFPLGWFTSPFMQSVLERLPFVAKVYTSVRQLIDTMMSQKPSSQRVVLVDFPIEGQKSIGFLTRTLTDAATGEPLAAVLLPNAINPTSAFLQVLPVSRVVETNLTMEQAMSMLMTGGAVGPDAIRYSQPVVTESVLPPSQLS